MRGHPQLHEQSDPTGGPRLTRRRVVAAASLAAVAGPLAACAPGQDGGAQNAATQAPVTLRYSLDEIVPSGQISSLGVPITGNAARSQHSGVELEWSVPHKSGLYLSGNVALSRNRFDDYREYVDSTTVNDYSGNSIAGFPDRIVNFTLGYRKQGATASLTLVETGRQFLDNSEDNRKSPALKDAPGYQHKFVEEHAVLNGALTLDLAGLTRSRPLDARRLALELHAQNLTGLKYETAGYVFAEVPYFYPASGRSVFVSLKAEF